MPFPSDLVRDLISITMTCLISMAIKINGSRGICTCSPKSERVLYNFQPNRVESTTFEIIASLPLSTLSKASHTSQTIPRHNAKDHEIYTMVEGAMLRDAQGNTFL